MDFWWNKNKAKSILINHYSYFIKELTALKVYSNMIV